VDAVGMRYSWHHMTKILHECQQEFDIQLNLKTPAPGPDSALALTYQIRSVLARRPIIPEPQFRLWETDEAQRDNSAIQVREHAKSLICEVIRQERQLHPRREDLLAGIALALDAETRSGPLLFVVCVVDEYPAGVLVSGHHHEGDSLMALFVRPAWRGNGLTQRLIGKWQSYAMERRLTRLRVQAAIFDEEHVALLEMASFRGPNQCAGGNLEWTPPSNVPDALPTPESSNPQATLS
jgi:GNAT superfamily N-acetyltransferase